MNPDYLQHVNGGWRVRMKVPKPLWPLAGGRQNLTWPTGVKAPKDDKVALAKARDVSRRTIDDFKAQIGAWQTALRLGVDAAPIRGRLVADAEAAERRARFTGQLPDQQLVEIEALSARFRRLRMAEADPAKPVDGEEVIKAWIAERRADNDPPKRKAIQNKRSKLARVFGFIAGKK